MKKIFISISFLVIFTISDCFTDNPQQKEVLVEKIIEAQGDNEKQDVSFIDQLVDKVAERFGNDKEKYKNLFNESFKFLNAEYQQKKLNFIKKEYTDNFSEAELQDIVKLMDDPAIHKLYSKQFKKLSTQFLWGKESLFDSEIWLELKNVFLDHAAQSGVNTSKIVEIKNKILNDKIAQDEKSKEQKEKSKEYFDKEFSTFVLSRSNKEITAEDKKIINDIFYQMLGINSLFESYIHRTMNAFKRLQNEFGEDFQKFITIAEAYKDSDDIKKTLKTSIWNRVFETPLGQFFSSSELKKIEQLSSQSIFPKYNQFVFKDLGNKVMANLPLISNIYVKAQIEALKKAKAAGLDEAMINSELQRLERK
ncbi:MAG: hypothetical protein Q8S31_06295 [Alphaproteobacteria bacterium]|nr:hypothetical protein [Alphaproteobacteria bacterium]